MKRIILLIFCVVTLSVQSKQAVLVLESDTYNFGKIGESDGLVTTTFYFSNKGDAPLVITKVRTSCGCAVAKYIQEPIAPNEKGWIIITYNPNGRPGKFSKTITVASNAINGTSQMISISGEVVAGGRGITTQNDKASTSVQSNKYIYVEVQQGESINSIAKKYGVRVTDISKINNVKTSQILKVGQTLLIPNKIGYIVNTQMPSQNPENEIALQKSNEERTSPIDSNIPIAKTNTDNTYVLIIANETYSFLDKVNYATNDGKIFKEYCIKTLGIPEKQIFLYENASYGLIADGVSKLTYCLDNFENSKAIVYYCGHGIPDEKTGQAYLIPVDGKGTNMTTCYSLKNLYKTLAATKAQSITYFMDACFTGANKEGSMLVAARGVAREPVKETLAGKTVVFSASSGDETAMTLEEQGHGLFTYYLLKKLQETEGNVTYGELADYINKNVKKDAFLINEKPQTPVVATSPAVQNTWKTMKLK